MRLVFILLFSLMLFSLEACSPRRPAKKVVIVKSPKKKVVVVNKKVNRTEKVIIIKK